jgi:uncharacterized delta-60 repeat protein
MSDDKLIIGGVFTLFDGMARSRITRLNSDGSLDDGFNRGVGANNTIRATLLQTDGKLIIAGDFTAYNNTPINRIARLNPDGSLDGDFTPGLGANNNVHAIGIQPDGKLIIGGNFNLFDGIVRTRIARLNSDGSLDTSFDPGGGATSTINTIALQSDGKIIIGGGFTQFNGIPRNRIAGLNSDGSLDTSFDPGNGFDDAISTILSQPDEKLIIGGSFILYNGSARNRIARLNSDGTLDTSFDPGTGASGTVVSIALQSDGKVIIGGVFTAFDGIARSRVARLNSNGSLDTGFNPGTGANSVISSVLVQPNDKVIIGGFFSLFDGTSIEKIARLNSDGSLDTGFDPGAGVDNIINSMILQPDGKLIPAGAFSSCDEIPFGRIARINTKYPQTTTFDALPEKTYGDATFDLDASSTSGLPITYTSSDPLVATVSGSTVTIVGVGTAEITASQAGNDDYDPANDVIRILTVNTKSLTISGLTISGKEYDGTTNAIISGTPTLEGVIGSEVVSLESGSLSATFEDASAGTDKNVTISGITLTGTDAGNYALSTTLSGGADIFPRAITVTTDAGQNKTYGSLDPPFTYQFTPDLIAGDNFDGALEREAGDDVDTYAITIGSLDAGLNYSVTFVTANFEITPLPVTVTANANQSKEYGLADPVMTYQVTPALIAGDSFNGALEREQGENVDTYAIAIGSLSHGNYTITFEGNIFSITPKTLSVTSLTFSDKEYDGTTDAIISGTPTLEGVVDSDDVTLESGSLSVTFEDASAGTGKNVTVSGITLTGTDAGNYVVSTSLNITANITPLAITVTANPNQSKVFGSADPVLTYTVNPSLVSGDSFTGQLSRVAGENAGSYAIAIGTLSAGSNYQITFESGNFIIEKASHTITFDLIEDRFNTSEPFTVNATAGSGLEVMFNILSGPATVNGNTVTLTGETGSVTVRASSEDENHYEATADQSFEITLDPVLGMEETWKRDIVIFPVPSDGMITIRSGEQEMQKVFLLDISGKLIWKSSQEKPVREMEIEIQEKGEFLVFIQTGKGMISRKIIKY